MEAFFDMFERDLIFGLQGVWPSTVLTVTDGLLFTETVHKRVVLSLPNEVYALLALQLRLTFDAALLRAMPTTCTR